MYHVVCIISPWAISSYISSEQGGGLIIRHKLLYTNIPYYISVLYIPIQELWAEEGGGFIIHHGLIIRTIRYKHFLMSLNAFTCIPNTTYIVDPQGQNVQAVEDTEYMVTVGGEECALPRTNLTLSSEQEVQMCLIPRCSITPCIHWDESRLGFCNSWVPAYWWRNHPAFLDIQHQLLLKVDTCRSIWHDTACALPSGVACSHT